MALYHEAANVIDSAIKSDESLKATVFSKKTWKSDSRTLFALSTEAAKWSEILTEVIERSEILQAEKHLTPSLALVLTYDLLLSKRGIALPAQHGLAASVTRYKARLQAELTKARIRHGCASLDALRSQINKSSVNGSSDNAEQQLFHPRWVRVNVLKTSTSEQLRSTFEDFTQVSSLSDLRRESASNDKVLYVDEHIPNLLALDPSFEITTTKAYKQGELILQDKASCFPAYLLDPRCDVGDIIDACAAPGNKTTHLAAILHEQAQKDRNRDHDRGKPPECTIIACEKDEKRAEVLSKMVSLAGGQHLIDVKSKQDFTRLDPNAKEFCRVKALLLDPSCSGSGIVSRHDSLLKIYLPSRSVGTKIDQRGTKRKRKASEAKKQPESPVITDPLEEEVPPQIDENDAKLQDRLVRLSDFQLRILKHAMAFPAAKCITYSTCSIHAAENEGVVVRALLSDIALQQGWRITHREEQVTGLKQWARRGDSNALRDILKEQDGVEAKRLLPEAEGLADACIRCVPGTAEGTMGFFLCGFVRNSGGSVSSSAGLMDGEVEDDESSEEEWNGFGKDDD